MAGGTVSCRTGQPRRVSEYSSRSTHRHTSDSSVSRKTSAAETSFAAAILRNAAAAWCYHNRRPAAPAILRLRSAAFPALRLRVFCLNDQNRSACCKTRRCVSAAVCRLSIACITHINFSSHVASAAVCLVSTLLFSRPAPQPLCVVLLYIMNKESVWCIH